MNPFMNPFYIIVFCIVIGMVIKSVARIIVDGMSKRAELSAIGRESFEELAAELKIELAAIKENLDSINKMLKEVE